MTSSNLFCSQTPIEIWLQTSVSRRNSALRNSTTLNLHFHSMRHHYFMITTNWTRKFLYTHSRIVKFFELQLYSLFNSNLYLLGQTCYYTYCFCMGGVELTLSCRSRHGIIVESPETQWSQDQKRRGSVSRAFQRGDWVLPLQSRRTRTCADLCSWRFQKGT